jgi:hypothetical protein
MKNQESKRNQAPTRDHEDSLMQHLMQQQAQPSSAAGQSGGAQTQSHEYSQISTNAPTSSAEPTSASSGGAAGANAAVMRAGTSIPGGASIEMANPESSAIIANLRSTGNAAAGGFGGNADWESNAAPLIENAIAANLNPRTISGSWVETRGINVRWNWRISFKIGAVREISGGGTGASEFGTGGTGSVGTSSSSATTDSASATGGYAQPNSNGNSGGASGSATVGTSTTRTDGTSTSVGLNTVGKTGATTNQVRYEAPVVVETYVSPELDMSGSDYINPFKLGMFGAEAASPMQRLSGEVTTGVVRYFISNGIAPSAPAQRRGWLEHELGITEESTRNAERMQELNALDPASFSRSGAQPLPGGVTQAAQAQYGASLGGVNLIHGGQADSYAQQMDAAAFTTPNAQGGSDIFVRSSVDLNSAAGQHTLQHEIAHAAQNKNGQTDQLSGLGGDPFQRHALERDADSKADGAMKQMTQNANLAANTDPVQGA